MLKDEPLHDERGTDEALAAALHDFLAEAMRSNAAEMLQLIKREGISMPRMVTLLFITREGPSSISDISDYLQLSLGNTSTLVEQLVNGGYVTRTEDSTDRRLKLVAPTAKGQGCVDEVKQARARDIARRLHACPPELREDFMRILGAITPMLQANHLPAS